MGLLTLMDFHGLVDGRGLTFLIGGRSGAFDNGDRLDTGLRAESQGHIFEVESIVIFEAGEGVVKED